MNETVMINGRYHGPPNSGNGGYTCGLVANAIDGTAQVTLRLPPPLDTPLTLTKQNDIIQLLADGQLIAEGEQAQLTLDIPTPPSMSAAQDAVSRYLGFHSHAFPTCFVCGPERAKGDGLHIYTGSVNGRNLVAAPWTPDNSLLAEDKRIRPEFMWAALDCPGAFAVNFSEDKVLVLGRLTVAINYRPQAAEPCLVMGWPMGSDGRKYFAGTAVFTTDGKLCGAGQATWIQLKPKP